MEEKEGIKEAEITTRSGPRTVAEVVAEQMIIKIMTTRDNGRVRRKETSFSFFVSISYAFCWCYSVVEVGYQVSYGMHVLFSIRRKTDVVSSSDGWPDVRIVVYTSMHRPLSMIDADSGAI